MDNKIDKQPLMVQCEIKNIWENVLISSEELFSSVKTM